jgi:glycosyltransferase involved in cell wall biosynthesis
MHIAVNGWFVGQSTTGSGQYIDHLLARLPALAPDVRWTLLLPPSAATAPSSGAWPGLEVQPIRLPRWPENLAKLWWEQWLLPRAAHRIQADLLWMPYWAAPYWQPLPVVVTVHDLIPALLPAYRGGVLQRLYTALVSATTHRAAGVITVSQASAQDILHHLRLPQARVHVVHSGPNQESLQRPDAATLRAVRHKFALPEHFFLYLGGFDVRKNVGATVRAYARYLARGGDQDIHLVIAGKLPDADTAFTPDPRRLVSELGLTDQIHFCGWVDEIEKAALYTLATAYLFPSRYEGFGMPVLEAMQAGAPVITSDQLKRGGEAM